MSTDVTSQMGCRSCGSPLNRYLDLATGTARYTHPANPTGQPADHEPDPAPADRIDIHHVCDFCSDEHIVYTFRTGRLNMLMLAPDEQLIQHYGSDWSACLECAELVQTRDVRGLAARIMRSGPPFDREVLDGIRAMQQARRRQPPARPRRRRHRALAADAAARTHPAESPRPARPAHQFCPEV
jgi:hypothetical protein